MTDIAASNVSYTVSIRDKKRLGSAGYLVTGSLAFGDGALTIPAGGIPLTKAKLGLPKEVKSFKIIESNGSGYEFSYDISAEKLLVRYYDYNAVADGAAIDAATVAIAATTIQFEARGY